MEPQIRYVRSADGTKIATATLGSGPHLVMIPPTPLSSIEGEWSNPLERAAIERIATTHTFVRFDPRGQGLSDRDVVDLALEARVADIEAVFENLPPAPAFVFSRGSQAPATITFAARHPDRVRRLVLSGAAARGRDYRLNEKRRAVGRLLDVDWELYCNAFAFVDFGWTEEGRQFALMISRATTPDIVRRDWAAMRLYDASDLLTSIRCPTLVVYTPERAGGVFVQPDAVRSLAARIPDARLQPSDGLMNSLASSPMVAEAVLQFFAEDMPEATAQEAGEGSAIIMFADIVGSTAMTERIGDAAFRERARALDTSLRAAIVSAGGTPVEGKLLGDGVLAVFTVARQAIDAALGCVEASREADLELHVGVHAGDVIREAGNEFGGAVNVASRIADAAAAGEVLVSDVVRSLARTSANATFEDRGEHEMKGVGEPVRVYAVRAGDSP
jgi:class 3 adenylate cyclase/pimeloyl-ACP methyl ester carboxylesterase